MEDTIESSPTSQKKRKKPARSRASQKSLKMDSDSQQNVIAKSLEPEQHKTPVGQTTEASKCLTRNDIWQYAYLMETVDKGRARPENTRVFNRFNDRNEFRMSRQAGFLNLTQLCAASQQPATSSNVDEVKESQWDVTESQFQKLDEAVKDFHDSEMKVQATGTSGHNNESIQVRKECMNKRNDFVQPLEEVLDDTTNDLLTASVRNSLERRSSVLQSILSEWPTSPVKMKKTESESTQLSPQFKFNTRRVKRKYVNRKGNAVETKKLRIQSNESSPATTSRSSEIKTHSNDEVDNIPHEPCQQRNAPHNVNDEEDVLNDSLNILDNLQNLSNYYTQSSQTTSNGNDVIELKTGESKLSDSRDAEEDFLGFDGHPGVTLPQRFYEFSSNSDNSTPDSNANADEPDKDSLTEDDDIFASFQKDEEIFASFKTQQCDPFVANHQADGFERPVASTSATALKGDPFEEKFPVESFRSTDAAVKKEPTRKTNIFEDIEIEFGNADGFAGFSSVERNFVSIPSAVAPNIFLKLDKPESELKLETDSFTEKDSDFQRNLNPSFTGFSTAWGDPIPVSSELIFKKTNIFQDLKVSADELPQMSNWIDEINVNDSLGMKRNHIDVDPSPGFAGFTTARGTHIPVSSSLMAKKTNIFQDVKVSADELPQMSNWIDDNERKDDPNIDSVSRYDINSIPAFTTARGRHIPVSSNKTDIFKNVTVTAEEVRNMNNWINDSEPSDSNSNGGSTFTVGVKPVPCSRPLFSRPVFNVESEISKRSTDLFREVTNITQRETDSLSKKLQVVDTFIRPSPMRIMSMANSLRKLDGAKENAGSKLNSVIVDDATPESPKNATTSLMHTPISSRAYICVTPTNNPKTYTQEARESAAAIMLDDELDSANDDARSKEQTPGYVAGFLTELTASSTPIHKVDNFRSRPKQRRLVEKFDDIAAEDYADSRVPLDTIKVQVSSHIKSLRKLAFVEQLQGITKKSDVQPVPSSLFIKKISTTKVDWREFVEHSRPSNRIPINTKLTSQVLNVTAENASNFTFNAWDYYTDDFCRENVYGIHLQDDIVVMMDENCQIGLKEISTAFLSCPSVDAKLIHHKWIENHMKWIVVKLAGMERSFPHRFAGQALTLENLLLQLKYRYEREIDLAERSAIRKICEMDDVAAKRIILFVARIKRNSLDCEVELSDGWYSLRSTLDYEITKLVNNGRIKVGTKLVIQGATTVDLDNGCHPLDVSDNVKLKIHANSTRRARWDSKLGYCKNSEPFQVSLRSVLPSGGNITKLRICVLRVYPVVYINPKKLSDVHSERAERRRSINDERERLIIVDIVYNEIIREFEEEEKAALRENRPTKIAKLAEIPSITDPAYLCDLMADDVDPARIESEMTSTQKTMVLNYKEKLNCERSEMIRARVTEKLSSVDKEKRKFVPLLRFRITDESAYGKIAVVTIWKPTEEILAMFKEETAYELTGSTVRGTSLNELQIYAGKDANFKKISPMNPVPTALCRHHTSISEILSIDQFALNELDTTGLVVHVGEISNKIQPVYIADSERNIICICFWESLKSAAYDDVVQPKRFLAIKNLQWRKSSNSKPIPCAHVTEYSIFTESPQSSELSSALTNLKSKLADVELDGFIEACMEKVRSHNSSFLPTPLRSYSSTSSLQSPASSSSSLAPRTPNDISLRSGRSSLSNQSRIEQLSEYGEGMSTPPLNISCFRRSFKLPTSKT